MLQRTLSADLQTSAGETAESDVVFIPRRCTFELQHVDGSPFIRLRLTIHRQTYALFGASSIIDGIYEIEVPLELFARLHSKGPRSVRAANGVDVVPSLGGDDASITFYVCDIPVHRNDVEKMLGFTFGSSASTCPAPTQSLEFRFGRNDTNSTFEYAFGWPDDVEFANVKLDQIDLVHFLTRAYSKQNPSIVFFERIEPSKAESIASDFSSLVDVRKNDAEKRLRHQSDERIADLQRQIDSIRQTHQ